MPGDPIVAFISEPAVKRYEKETLEPLRRLAAHARRTQNQLRAMTTLASEYGVPANVIRECLFGANDSEVEPA